MDLDRHKRSPLDDRFGRNTAECLLNERTIRILACPLDRSALRVDDGGLAWESGPS
jgi:hypothetical protein